MVLLHGAWHGAWCWENFLPFFAEQGYEVHAISLRGHGNSEGREQIRWFSVRDYVADLSSVVDSLDTLPVLIAHSMGGYVAQKYLESHILPASVFLATIPTVGILPMLLRMLRRHPGSTLKALLLMNPWYFVYTPSLAKDYLFSDDFPDDRFRDYFPRIQPESFRMALEAAFLDLPHPRKVRTPLLVLGAEKDRVFSPAEQHRTARAYKTEAHIYRDMAHDMMLEQRWGSVAEKILAWLNSRGL